MSVSVGAGLEWKWREIVRGVPGTKCNLCRSSQVIRSSEPGYSRVLNRSRQRSNIKYPLAPLKALFCRFFPVKLRGLTPDAPADSWYEHSAPDVGIRACGSVAQLVRASSRQGEGPQFESEHSHQGICRLQSSRRLPAKGGSNEVIRRKPSERESCEPGCLAHCRDLSATGLRPSGRDDLAKALAHGCRSCRYAKLLSPAILRYAQNALVKMTW